MVEGSPDAEGAQDADRPIPCRRSEDVTVTGGSAGSADRFYLKTAAGALFAFGEQEYFLWKSLDGRTSFTEVAAAFVAEFGVALSPRLLAEFISAGISNGIIEHEAGSDYDLGMSFETPARPAGDPREERAPLPKLPKEPLSVIVGDPQKLFGFLARVFWPLGYLKWVWVPASFIACLTIVKHWTQYQADYWSVYKSIPYEPCMYSLEHVLAALARIIEGSIITYFGGSVRYLGLRCFMGVMVRVFIDERGAREMELRARCWAKGGSLIFRVLVFDAAVFIWILTRAGNPILSKTALFTAVLAFITLYLNALPLVRGDGYELLATYLNIHDLQGRSSKLMSLHLSGRNTPTGVTAGKRIGFAFFAVGSFIASFFIIGHILLEIDSFIYGAVQGLGLLIVTALFVVAGFYFYYLRRFFNSLNAFKKEVFKRRNREERSAQA